MTGSRGACARSEERRLERVRMMFEADIAGATYRGCDLSIGGFGLFECPFAAGRVDDVVLRLKHPDLELAFAVSARQVGAEPATRVTGFEFASLTPQQAYVLDAILAAASARPGRELGDDFLSYAVKMAHRAYYARCLKAPLAI